MYFCLDHTVYAWEPSAFVNAPGMQSEPFPVVPVAAVVAVVVVVGAGLLLYFKKRKRQPRITRDGN